MAKLVKKLSLKQGDTKEEFYFDATTGVKGYDYYNSEETIVGRWVDGRPIYRRVFDQVMPASDPNRVIWDFKGVNVDAILDVRGIATAAYPNSNRHGFSLTGDWHNVVQSRWWVRYDQQYLYMQYASSSGIGGNRAYVMVDYTKTTDQPDSFVEEKVELTAEHKTGETFNGKDVYEKCLTGTTGASAGSMNLSMANDDVDEVIDFWGNMVRGRDGITWPINYRDSSDQLLVWYRPDYKAVVFSWSSSFINSPIKVWVKYTKKA